MQRDSFNHEPAVTRGLIECLRSWFRSSDNIIVVSDSNWVCNGCSSWTVKVAIRNAVSMTTRKRRTYACRSRDASRQRAKKSAMEIM
jgi:ribonuclease HI